MRPKIKPPQSRLKICYVITKSAWGGAQRYVYDLAAGLPKDRFEVMVVHGPAGALTEQLGLAEIKSVSLPSLGRDVKIWSDIRTFFALWRLFKREKPDIVHLNSSKIGAMGALAGRLARVPKIIYTAHGWAFNERRLAWQLKLITFIHWLTVIWCHQVITVAKVEADQVRHWRKTAGKFVTIYNGIEPAPLLYRDTARERLSMRDPDLSPYRRDFWLGTIAELHPNKDLFTAIGAIKLVTKQYPEIRFVIIGSGEQREVLEKLISELELTHNVFLLGPLPQAAHYLKAFDIFLFNSRKEGLPYAILEAGLAALPVVATTVGGIPEIIENGQTGVLIPPEEPAATAEAIFNLMANGLEREILGRNLESVIRTRFSVERMVAETIKLYTK
jgi:glycosyltransferase involved in cell wall biosynthesis